MEDQNQTTTLYKQKLSYAALDADGGVPALPVYSQLAGIKEWGTLPSLEGSKTESTDLDGASTVKQYSPVDSEPGTLECTLGFNLKDGSAANATLTPLYMVKQLFKIEFANGDTHEQVGFLDLIGDAVRGEKDVAVKIRIQFSGAPTYTEAA